MNVEEYFKRMIEKGHSYEKCGFHYCLDWDELPVCKCSLESNCCNCTFEEVK